jgi:hypothetical protein
MKALYIFLFVMFTGLTVYSQGNLQFNQVLVLDASTSGTAHSVPAGKVWKIESVAIAANSSYFQIQWAGVNYFLVSFAAGYNMLPFWLPSSASVTFIASATTKVSVIEFNVVP